MEPLVIENIDFGNGSATFDGVYLGRTKGETQFSYGIETYRLETEEDGVVDEVIIDDALTVTIPLIYTDLATLQKVIPWATLVIDGSKQKLVVGKSIGTRLEQYAKQLVIHPEAMGADVSKDLTIFKCYPKPGPINFSYARSGERIANIQFVATRDATKPVGNDYFCIGDSTAILDTTPPSVSSTLPLDGAIDVNKLSGLIIDFVMSEPIDTDTVIKANTLIMNLVDNTVFTDYTVSYISASNTIRLTTGSDLMGSTEYAVTLNVGIKDVNGNALAAPYVLTFTTAI